MSSHTHEILDHVPDPFSPLDEPDEPSDLDDFDPSRADDDSRWDVFLPDDELDPLPSSQDFWLEPD
jgi:hypothetical protein